MEAHCAKDVAITPLYSNIITSSELQMTGRASENQANGTTMHSATNICHGVNSNTLAFQVCFLTCTMDKAQISAATNNRALPFTTEASLQSNANGLNKINKPQSPAATPNNFIRDVFSFRIKYAAGVTHKGVV